MSQKIFHIIPASLLKRFNINETDVIYKLNNKNLNIEEYITRFSIVSNSNDDNQKMDELSLLNNIVEKYWNMSRVEEKVLSEFIDIRKKLKKLKHNNEKEILFQVLPLQRYIKSIWEKLDLQVFTLENSKKSSIEEIILYATLSFWILWNYFPEYHDEIYNKIENSIEDRSLKDSLSVIIRDYKFKGLNINSELSHSLDSNENRQIMLPVYHDK